PFRVSLQVDAAVADLEARYFDAATQQGHGVHLYSQVRNASHVLLLRPAIALRMPDHQVARGDVRPGNKAATPLPVDVKVALYRYGPLQGVGRFTCDPWPQHVPVEHGHNHD